MSAKTMLVFSRTYVHHNKVLNITNLHGLRHDKRKTQYPTNIRLKVLTCHFQYFFPAPRFSSQLLEVLLQSY